MTLALSGFVLRPMLSKRITRTCRALCSQTGFLNPASLLSTKKRHYLPACLLKSPLCSFFAQRPTKPLSYHRINTNIKHQAGEWAPLSDTRKASNGFPKLLPARQTICAWFQNFVWRQRSLGPSPYPVMILRHHSQSKWSYAFLKSTKTWYSGSCSIQASCCANLASIVAVPVPRFGSPPWRLG